jgi:hypothetical protein
MRRRDEVAARAFIPSPPLLAAAGRVRVALCRGIRAAIPAIRASTANIGQCFVNCVTRHNGVSHVRAPARALFIVCPMCRAA